MTEPRFNPQPTSLDLAALLALTGARAAEGAGARPVSITGVASLGWAGPTDLAYVEEDATDGFAALRDTDAGVCLVPPVAAPFVSEGAVALTTERPREAFLAVAGALFPSAARPVAMFGPGVAAGAAVHAEARLEPDVSIDPGAVVGPGAEIGRGSIIGPNAVIGAGVRIGRDSAIGAGAVVECALIGDRVVIQAGVALGHAAGVSAAGAPALGRAIVQDDAEIGANAAIARGLDRDTIIGEATRVDALARIAADVVIGRHCLVYAAAPLPRGAAVNDFTICGLADDRQPPAPKDATA